MLTDDLTAHAQVPVLLRSGVMIAGPTVMFLDLVRGAERYMMCDDSISIYISYTVHGEMQLYISRYVSDETVQCPRLYCKFLGLRIYTKT